MRQPYSPQSSSQLSKRLVLVCLSFTVVLKCSAAFGAADKLVSDTLRNADWKDTATEAPQKTLSHLEYRIGTWRSEKMIETGGKKHWLEVRYAWDLNKTVIRETSTRIYEDGRKERYLEQAIFVHGGTGKAVAFLHFDDGLFADAVWVNDGDGVSHLDCDLYWLDGRTARVRDFFVRDGDDKIQWRMYWVKDDPNGGSSPKVDEQPSFSTTLIRVKDL